SPVAHVCPLFPPPAPGPGPELAELVALVEPVEVVTVAVAPPLPPPPTPELDVVLLGPAAGPSRTLSPPPPAFSTRLFALDPQPITSKPTAANPHFEEIIRTSTRISGTKAAHSIMESLAPLSANLDARMRRLTANANS